MNKDYIEAIYVKSTNEILYSRSRHDFRESSDKSVFIDGGRDYSRIGGSFDNFVKLKLNPYELLNMILVLDYAFKNINAKDYKEGYHGILHCERFSSHFLAELVENYHEIIDVVRVWK